MRKEIEDDKVEAGKDMRKTLAALVTTVFVFAGLGLLGYSLLAGGSPASAEDPGRVHGRISEELEAKFHRSIPERIVEKVRGDDRGSKTPESKELELTVPGMKRVDGVPVYDAAERVRQGPPRRRGPREGHRFPLAEGGQRLHRRPQGRLPGNEEQPGVLGPQQAREGG